MDRGDIDVAYVLEGIPGVLGVYAVRGLERVRHAVHVDVGGYVIARVQYALLRVFTHEECVAVALYQVELPGIIREKATRLVLSSDARAEASARVPLTTPALEQTLAIAKASPTPTWSYRRALIVTDDEDLACAAVSAFGTDARRFVIADPFAALWEAKAQPFDVILCDLDRAFGIRGFVSNLTLDAPELADRVVLLMPANGDTEPRSTSTDSGRLRKPLTAANLVDVAAGARSKPDPTGSRPRVLLMDDTIRRTSWKNAPFSLTLAHDGWEALERIHEEWALVICSLTMKTDTGARLYSLLWKARPDIKRRFALLVDHPDGSNRVLARPLTSSSVSAMLDRVAIHAAAPP